MRTIPTGNIRHLVSVDVAFCVLYTDGIAIIGRKWGQTLIVFLSSPRSGQDWIISRRNSSKTASCCLTLLLYKLQLTRLPKFALRDNPRLSYVKVKLWLSNLGKPCHQLIRCWLYGRVWISRRVHCSAVAWCCCVTQQPSSRVAWKREIMGNGITSGHNEFTPIWSLKKAKIDQPHMTHLSHPASLTCAAPYLYFLHSEFLSALLTCHVSISLVTLESSSLVQRSFHF